MGMFLGRDVARRAVGGVGREAVIELVNEFRFVEREPNILLGIARKGTTPCTYSDLRKRPSAPST